MDAEIDAQFAAIADDVLAWKLRGAALWQGVGAAAAAALLVLSARAPPPSLASALDFALRLALAYGTTLLVLLAQRRVLAARDVPPVRLPRLMLLGGIGGGGGGGGGNNGATTTTTTAASWPALFASRCVLRTRRLPDVLAALALYGSYALSGAVGVALLSGAGGGGGGDSGSGSGSGNAPRLSSLSLFPAAYGALLGLLSASGHLLGCRNVVSYPSLDLRRWPRLRRRARAAARSALVGASAALALALVPALVLFLRRPPGPHHDHHHLLVLPSPADAVRAWRAALVCSLAWLAGAHALDVVFGEPMQFAGGDASAAAGDEAAALAEQQQQQQQQQQQDKRRHSSSSSSAAADLAALSVAPTALLAALRHPDPIVQDWAMRDLCLSVAEKAGPRRRAVFADATGATGWLPATTACLAEVRRACHVLSGESYADLDSAGRLAEEKKKDDGDGGSKAARAAATLARASAAAAGAAGGATPAADVAAWYLRAHTPRLAWASRALAGLCAASLREDSYGVALETGTLGESVSALLALEAALEARRRAVAAGGGFGGGVRGGGGGGGGGVGGNRGGGTSSRNGSREVLMDAAAEALLDAVQGGIYRVAGAFGEAIAPVVAASAAEAAAADALLPPVQSAAQLSARLRRYLDGEV